MRGVVQNLIETARIRLMLARLGAIELKQIAERLYLRFKPLDGAQEGGAGGVSEITIEKALTLVKGDAKRFRITADNRFVYVMETLDGEVIDPLEEARYILKEFLE